MHISEVLQQAFKAGFMLNVYQGQLYIQAPATEVGPEIMKLLADNKDRIIGLCMTAPNAYRFTAEGNINREVVCLLCDTFGVTGEPISEQRIQCPRCGKMAMVTPVGIG